MKVKSNLLLLIFLTLTVAYHNYQFYNVPHSMYLNAYNLHPERLTYFHLTLPSKGIPNLGFRDVTNNTDFRIVLDYIIASDTISYPIKVCNGDPAEWWLKNISNFSEYDMTLKYYNDTYFLQVRYLPDTQRTTTENQVLWTINIATIIAGLHFIVTETSLLKKWIKEERK